MVPNFDGLQACAEVGTEIFYPYDDTERVMLSPSREYVRARKVCMGCEVVNECAEWAIITGEEHGMWGGLTPKERHRIRRDRGLLDERWTA
jgi:WhiB family transcriptional regulator, redox-sensing transcriptional regulator